MDSDGGKPLGLLMVDRPVPDPDTRFDSLANGPHLDSLPEDIRAKVDLASLIPSPTKGCRSDEYVYIFPVSMTCLTFPLNSF